MEWLAENISWKCDKNFIRHLCEIEAILYKNDLLTGSAICIVACLHNVMVLYYYDMQ